MNIEITKQQPVNSSYEEETFFTHQNNSTQQNSSLHSFMFAHVSFSSFHSILFANLQTCYFRGRKRQQVALIFLLFEEVYFVQCALCKQLCTSMQKEGNELYVPLVTYPFLTQFTWFLLFFSRVRLSKSTYVPTHTSNMVINIEKGNYFVRSEKYDDVEQFS